MLGLPALLLAVLERLPRFRWRSAPFLRPHLGTDLVYLLTGYVAVGELGRRWVVAATASLDARTELGGLVWARIPFGVQIAVALVAVDLGNYAAHWALHRFDALWRFHEAHHSSRHLDWVATFRSHVVEQLLRRALAPLLLILAGVPTPAVTAAAGIFFCWAMLNHANLRLPLGALETVLVTPRLHRLHHVPATTERNLGTVLTCWDWLRGTLVVADAPADVRLGLPRGGDEYPQGWLGQLVAPWDASRRR